MSVIVILIIASLLIASGFLMAFIWSVSKGHYEDDTSPAIRILFDDTITPSSEQNSQNP